MLLCFFASIDQAFTCSLAAHFLAALSLIAAGLADANELKKIDQEVRKEIDAAVGLARSDAELGDDELYTHIIYKPR